jgi:hypothetical protein
MKLMIALAGVLAAVAVGGALALATADDTSADTPGVDLTGPTAASVSTSTEEDATTTSRVDVSGPCDEAEHANDPRCTGDAAVEAPAGAGVDISGPCDEAEHANDPRCTGAAGGDDDRRNRGPGGGGDDDRKDNSGPSGDSD